MTNPPIQFQSILIYGMGMMGASLADTLRNHPGFHGRIGGVVRSQKSADYIRQLNLADDIYIKSDLSAELPFDPNSYDLIIIALPVCSAIKLLEVFPDCRSLITDMSSTRTNVNRAAESRPKLRFVGSHPICGSEESGPSALRKGLYQNRLCIITALNETENREQSNSASENSRDLNMVVDFWRAIGMNTWVVSGDTHDEIMAYLSHAPHVISGLLTLWARNNPAVSHGISSAPIPLTGGGFKDMSRIAGSNPEMWNDILSTNREHVIKALENFTAQTQAIIEEIRRGDDSAIQQWFRDSREARDILRGPDAE